MTRKKDHEKDHDASSDERLDGEEVRDTEFTHPFFPAHHDFDQFGPVSERKAEAAREAAVFEESQDEARDFQDKNQDASEIHEDDSGVIRDVPDEGTTHEAAVRFTPEAAESINKAKLARGDTDLVEAEPAPTPKPTPDMQPS